MLAPSTNVRSQSHQLLETFRYTGQPALIAAPRTLEFFRYTTLADDNAAPSRSIQPLEMFPSLMILALFLLAIENLLSNRFYTRPGSNATTAAAKEAA